MAVAVDVLVGLVDVVLPVVVSVRHRHALFSHQAVVAFVLVLVLVIVIVIVLAVLVVRCS